MSKSVKLTADIAYDLTLTGQASGKQYHKEWPRWKPPASGIIKLNVDAGFSPNNNEGATGVIVRDHSGALLRGQAIWYG